MCVVRLDDHRAAGGESGRGVAARDGECEREVAGAEYGHRAERHGALADVGPGQRGPVGLGGIDARAGPAALPQHLGEQAKLSGGASDFAGDASLRKAGLGSTARATRGALMASRLEAMASRNTARCSEVVAR